MNLKVAVIPGCVDPLALVAGASILALGMTRRAQANESHTLALLKPAKCTDVFSR